MAGSYGAYATVDQLKQYLTSKQVQNQLVRDDSKLMQLTMRVSGILDKLCRRTFYPRLETRYYGHPDYSKEAIAYSNTYQVVPYTDELRLDDDLVEVTELKTQNGNVTISNSDFYLKTGRSYNKPPYSIIELKHNSSSVFTFTGTSQKANSVTGYWGFMPHWDDAWASIGTLAMGINDSITTLQLNEDLESADEDGFAPAFQRQQLLRIGSEFMFCTGVDYPDQEVTVVRGVNGTTAAAALADATVQVFRPEFEVVETALILANYYYHRRDSIGRPEDRPIATPTGTMVLSSQMPAEVQEFVVRNKKSWRSNSWR